MRISIHKALATGLAIATSAQLVGGATTSSSFKSSSTSSSSPVAISTAKSSSSSSVPSSPTTPSSAQVVSPTSSTSSSSIKPASSSTSVAPSTSSSSIKLVSSSTSAVSSTSSSSTKPASTSTSTSITTSVSSYVKSTYAPMSTTTQAATPEGCTTRQVPKYGATDFLFIIDSSSSMCPYIAQLTNRMQTFVTGLKAKNVTDARFGIVLYGGSPVIFQAFTSDAAAASYALSKVPCNMGGQEAAFEAIRMSLAGNNGADYLRKCVNGDTSSANCNISWRTNVTKSMILITDEDSDLPIYTKYRMPGQSAATSLCAAQYSYNSWSNSYYCSSTFEPGWNDKTFWTKYAQYFRYSKDPIVLDPTYQSETDLTADLVIANEVQISILMKSDFNANAANPNSGYNPTSLYWNATHTAATWGDQDPLNIHTTIVQFGHPDLAVQSADWKTFDQQATYNALVNNGHHRPG
ncbi:hypothetical protein HDU89_003126 [Geranomyces variabilis]|nr:hypothetical protein HDU89_003126 [Geranomyces variabilis]